MDIDDFDYRLPQELIAQYPLTHRVDSRLLVTDSITSELTETSFNSIDRFLSEGDMVIVNDTRVVPARIQATKPSGGKVEVMLERIVSARQVLVQLKSNKSLRHGQKLLLGNTECEIIGRLDRFFLIEFDSGCDIESLFHQFGSMPLPPYIKRQAEIEDQQRYQTVFAQRSGAVAAPTAGLHFDQQLIERIRSNGVQWRTLTLHVGAGTFLPVQSDGLENHVMHKEWIDVDQDLCDAVANTRSRGGKIVAVGTTVVRALETASRTGRLQPYKGDTELFIQPGFEFHSVDKLITNFHLPKSTLLVLVSAFAGYDRIMNMYQYAIQHQFRFFSYGDAMLLEHER